MTAAEEFAALDGLLAGLIEALTALRVANLRTVADHHAGKLEQPEEVATRADRCSSTAPAKSTPLPAGERGGEDWRAVAARLRSKALGEATP